MFILPFFFFLLKSPEKLFGFGFGVKPFLAKTFFALFPKTERQTNFKDQKGTSFFSLQNVSNMKKTLLAGIIFGTTSDNCRPLTKIMHLVGHSCANATSGRSFGGGDKVKRMRKNKKGPYLP